MSAPSPSTARKTSAPPPEFQPRYLGHNWGSIVLLSTPGRNLRVIEIHPNRGLYGNMILNPGIEFRYNGTLDSGFTFSSAGDSNYKHIYLGGSIGQSGNEVKADPHTLIVAKSANALASETRKLYGFRDGVFDFNGFSVPSHLFQYSEIACVPSFINNNLNSPVTLSGTVEINLNNGTPMFGGLGDLTHTGTSFSSREEGRLRKAGPGTLTLAGTDYEPTNVSPYFNGGKVIFDYTTHNTHRTFNNGPYAVDTHLLFKGHPTEPTTVTLANIKNTDTVILETQPGAGGMTLNFGKINEFRDTKTFDFRLGEGTTVHLTDPSFGNDESFGGINPNVTWDHGRSWAYATPDGSIGPMPSSLFSSTVEPNVIWDVPAGNSTLDTSTAVKAVRIAGTTGGTTLTLNKTLSIQGLGPNNGVSALLISPDVGGPVVIDGSRELIPTQYHRTMTIHNNCTQFPTRISARLNDSGSNGLRLIGPGTTLLDNDANRFHSGPSIFGGGTLQFTSIADYNTGDINASVSSLGCGGNTEIAIGNDSTLEYVGTTAEGHESNRRFRIYGTSTLLANGAGPLRLTAENAISAAYSATRLILAGEGEGILEGGINPGPCGWVEKRGSGTWTLNGTSSSYEYPTKALEGTLVLNGTLPSSLEIADGATVVCGEGATIKRHLNNQGTLRYKVDKTAATHEPITVWGEAILGGSLEMSGTVRESTVILSAENGITGEFSSLPPAVKVRIEGNHVVVDPFLPTILLFR